MEFTFLNVGIGLTAPLIWATCLMLPWFFVGKAFPNDPFHKFCRKLWNTRLLWLMFVAGLLLISYHVVKYGLTLEDLML